MDTEKNPNSLRREIPKEIRECLHGLNPGFQTKSPAYTDNCQRCVMAYDERRANALQQQTSIVNKRQLLIEKGMVDDNFRLAQDWTFSSPSLAACIVLGHNANGRTVWKEANGRSLKAMEEQGEM